MDICTSHTVLVPPSEASRPMTEQVNDKANRYRALAELNASGAVIDAFSWKV